MKGKFETISVGFIIFLCLYFICNYHNTKYSWVYLQYCESLSKFFEYPLKKRIWRFSISSFLKIWGCKLIFTSFLCNWMSKELT